MHRLAALTRCFSTAARLCECALCMQRQCFKRDHLLFSGMRFSFSKARWLHDAFSSPFMRNKPFISPQPQVWPWSHGIDESVFQVCALNLFLQSLNLALPTLIGMAESCHGKQDSHHSCEIERDAEPSIELSCLPTTPSHMCRLTSGTLFEILVSLP